MALEEEQKSEKSFISKLRNNLWITSTFVLAIFALIIIFSFVAGTLRISGQAISENAAGQKVLDFYTSLGAEGLKVESVEDVSGVYKVVLSYNGRSIPVYLTKDGKYVGMLNSLEEIKAAVEEENPSVESTQEVPKADKPEVELFVMSFCPFGTQMEKGILPVIKLLGDKIDFKVKFVDYAMHGKKEVDEQLRQYCIQKEQESKFLDYLQCFLEDGNYTRCLDSVGIDKAKLNSCISKTDSEFGITEGYNDRSRWISERFPPFDIHKELNEKYGVRGSPTLVINGKVVSSGRSPSALLSVICAAFNEKPSECDTELSSETPSPGFGYENEGASGSAGQCS